jgi:hypothetical protein
MWRMLNAEAVIFMDIIAGGLAFFFFMPANVAHRRRPSTDYT